MRSGVALAVVAPMLAVAAAFGGCGGDDGSASDEPVPAGRSIESGTKPEGQAALAELPLAEERARFDAPDTQRIIGTSDMTIEQYLEFVIGDVANFWADQFGRANTQLPTVNYAIVNAENEPVPAGCGAGNLYSDGSGDAGFLGPFYCPLDNTVYLPAGWLFDEAYGIEGREFGVAYAVAHEVGHHLQEVSGILPRKRAGEFLSKQIELQADCLAGVWARTIYDRNLLEGNDLPEAVSLAGQLGDVPGTPLEQEHGTDAERIAAFSTGFESRAAACTF